MLLGQKDFSEIVELRLTMEQQGLWYLLVKRREDTVLRNQTIKALEQDVIDLEAAIASGSTEGRLEADYNFHGHIITACNNEIFKNLYSTMRQFMVSEIHNSQKVDIYYYETAVPRHRRLLDLVKEGNYEKASEEFRHHIRNIDALLDAKMKNG
jgi:DNA-binding GntR family transcriptional regulator